VADLIISDSRLEMPSLFYPNRKPVGKVKIDWSHPLTDGLVGAWILNTVQPINLVDGHITQNILGASMPRPQILDFDSTVAGDPYHLILQQGFDFSKNATVIARTLKVGTEGWPVLFGIGNYPSSTFRWVGVGYWGTGSELRLYSNGTTTMGNINRNTWINSAFSTDTAANVAKAYIDGLLQATSTVPVISDVDTVGLFGNGSADTADLGDYKGEYVFAFNKTLRADAIKSINDNPYQFLVPV